MADPKTEKEALQKRQKDQINKFMASLAARKSSFQALLPKGMSSDWFFSEVRVALARAPGLALCEEISVFDALTTCAQLGLSPSGRLGSAYLIPYKTKCTLVVGYKGYVDLAYRSGDVVGFHAQVVYDGDEFEWEEGLEPRLRHVRSEDATPGQTPMRAVYAVGSLRGGYKTFVVMTAKEVERIRARSPGAAQTSSPWHSDTAEMWKKTAVRRLIKMLPLSPQKAVVLNRAQEVEDAIFEELEPMAPDEASGEPAKSGMDKLAAQLGAGAATETLEFTTEGQKEPALAGREALLAEARAAAERGRP